MNDDEPLIPEPDGSQPDPANVADRFRQQVAKQTPKKDMPKFLGVDPQRLTQITEQACIRIDECRSELGSIFGHYEPQLFSLIWDRWAARQMYAGNMSVRRGLIGGIFNENNWSLNVPQRIIRMLAAQNSGDLVGSDPFCAVMPEKSDDPAMQKLSKQTEKKVQAEIERCDARSILAESIRVALIEGERPIKITWEEDKTQFMGDAVVMVFPLPQPAQPPQQPPDEEGTAAMPEPAAPDDEPPQAPPDAKPVPITTEDGEYIFQKDEFLRFYVDQDDKPVALAMTTPPDLTTGAPASTAPQQPPGTSVQLRLKKDPSFALDPSMLDPEGKPIFALVKDLKQTITHHKGLVVAGLFPEDFVYPPRCTSLKDPSCDIMAHSYDLPLADVQAKFKGAGFAEDYLQLRETGPMSQQNEPDYKMGESRVTDSRKLVNLHETYFRIRVNPDDESESWVFIVIDYIQRIPVYAEFLGNMKMKRPPFGFLRGVESEPGRAYGVGVYKKCADKNLAIDVWFNRAALKSSKTASITFQHENGWKAEYQGQKLVIGDGTVYKIPANVSEQYGPDHPPVFRVMLNEMSDKEYELMEKLIQDLDLCFGVVNTAPEVAQQVGKGTATAVRNVERTGNILQRSTEEMMASDIEYLLELMTDTVIENLDEESIEWTPDEDEIAVLSRDEVRNLPRDVRVLLTKAKGEENLAINQQASQIVETYYSKPMSLRKKVCSFYRQQLKSLFFADADETIEEPTDEEIQAEAAQPPPNPHPVESIGIKLADLLPTEQVQALAQIQITADPQRTAIPQSAPSNVMPLPAQNTQTEAQPLAQPPAS